MYEMDETTGLPIYPSKEEAEDDKSVDAYFGKRVAGGLHNSCEGPYVYCNKETGYYYLLVSYLYYFSLNKNLYMLVLD